MLPDIAGDQWCQPRGHRVAGIGSVDDGERAVTVFDQPCPAGAEIAGSGCGKLLLECFE